MTLNSNPLATMLLCFKITNFNGFSLATFNFPDGKQEPNQLRHEHLCRLVVGVN